MQRSDSERSENCRRPLLGRRSSPRPRSLRPDRCLSPSAPVDPSRPSRRSDRRPRCSRQHTLCRPRLCSCPTHAGRLRQPSARGVSGAERAQQQSRARWALLTVGASAVAAAAVHLQTGPRPQRLRCPLRRRLAAPWLRLRLRHPTEAAPVPPATADSARSARRRHRCPLARRCLFLFADAEQRAVVESKKATALPARREPLAPLARTWAAARGLQSVPSPHHLALPRRAFTRPVAPVEPAPLRTNSEGFDRRSPRPAARPCNQRQCRWHIIGFVCSLIRPSTPIIYQI